MASSKRIFIKIIAALILVSLFNSCFAKVNPDTVDVEAVVKKEQPDFEDDAGNNIPLTGKKDFEGSQAKMQPMSSGTPEDTTEGEKDISFTHGFVASLFIIVVSELGDKTFFISAIMAMSHPRAVVFFGAMTALAAMHVMSAVFGNLIKVIPRVYTFYASTFLFAVFGIKMLREGWLMSADEGKEELEEVQTDLKKRDDTFDRQSLEEGGSAPSRRWWSPFLSRTFIEALTLNALAEWGDRSQIATVLMAAREDVMGVIVGGLIGHSLCTGLAVLGGRMIASRISVRQVTLIGGVVFMLFAVSALIMGP